jgi:hypothetical protein
MFPTVMSIVNVIGSIASLLEEVQQEYPTSVDLTTDNLTAISHLFSDTCDALLKKNWIDTLNKTKYSQSDISVLVYESIKRHPLPLDRIRSLIGNAIEEFLSSLEEGDFAKKDVSNFSTETYPTLSLQSFNLYYSPMFSYLLNCWQVLKYLYFYMKCNQDNAITNCIYRK